MYFCRLTHNDVFVGLHLKHGDLSASVCYQEGISLDVELYVDRLVWLVLVL